MGVKACLQPCLPLVPRLGRKSHALAPELNTIDFALPDAPVRRDSAHCGAVRGSVISNYRASGRIERSVMVTEKVGVEESVVCPRCSFKYVLSSEKSTQTNEVIHRFVCPQCSEPIDILWPSGLEWKILRADPPARLQTG